MLPLSPLRFSTIGKPILRTFEILEMFRFSDNSSRTRAKATARAMAMATAMARATARSRRTRARAKDRARAGRTDGRTAGRSYLFSEMRNPVLVYSAIELRNLFRPRLIELDSIGNEFSVTFLITEHCGATP